MHVRVNRLDSHQLSIERSLTSVGNPPGGGESSIKLSKATMSDPITLGQKAAPGGNYLKSAQTPATYLTVVE